MAMMVIGKRTSGRRETCLAGRPKIFFPLLPPPPFGMCGRLPRVSFSAILWPYGQPYGCVCAHTESLVFLGGGERSQAAHLFSLTNKSSDLHPVPTPIQCLRIPAISSHNHTTSRRQMPALPSLRPILATGHTSQKEAPPSSSPTTAPAISTSTELSSGYENLFSSTTTPARPLRPSTRNLVRTFKTRTIRPSISKNTSSRASSRRGSFHTLSTFKSSEYGWRR
jgi:hypothetical protein